MKKLVIGVLALLVVVGYFATPLVSDAICDAAESSARKRLERIHAYPSAEQIVRWGEESGGERKIRRAMRSREKRLPERWGEWAGCARCEEKRLLDQIDRSVENAMKRREARR